MKFPSHEEIDALLPASVKKKEPLAFAYLAGLSFYEYQLKKGLLIADDEFARRLGKNKTIADVGRLHGKGKIYALAPNAKTVDDFLKYLPEKKEAIATLLEFREQGKMLLYPSWQIKEGKKKNIIRPEIAKAREAYVLFAQQAAKRGFQIEQKLAMESQLDSLFSCIARKDNGGTLGDGSFSQYIIAQDKQKPVRPLTRKDFAKIWDYHENLEGGFG